jgi:hypothetical protein
VSVKNPFKEVLFLVHGDWTVEGFAWAKELARILAVPFRIIQDEASIENMAQRLLHGDGYYIGHYHYPLPKTQVIKAYKNFNSDGIGWNTNSNLVILILNQTSETEFTNEFLQLNKHIILTVPNSIPKAEGVSEFINILRRISILSLPFDVMKPVHNSLLSRLKQGFQSFL